MYAYINFRIPEWLDKIFAWPVVIYRRHRYQVPFRKIPLGGRYFAIVSPVDYYSMNKFHWSARKNHDSIYAVRFAGEDDKGPEIVSMHREIMNPPQGLLVDHKDCNTLHNTRFNLRNATRSQNLFNRRKINPAATSKFNGVSENKLRRRWEVYIGFGGRIKWIGSFKDEITAARAYDEAAKKYHGEFAKLNFPDPGEVRRAALLRKITHGTSD